MLSTVGTSPQASNPTSKLPAPRYSHKAHQGQGAEGPPIRTTSIHIYTTFKVSPLSAKSLPSKLRSATCASSQLLVPYTPALGTIGTIEKSNRYHSLQHRCEPIFFGTKPATMKFIIATRRPSRTNVEPVSSGLGLIKTPNPRSVHRPTSNSSAHGLIIRHTSAHHHGRDERMPIIDPLRPDQLLPAVGLQIQRKVGDETPRAAIPIRIGRGLVQH